MICIACNLHTVWYIDAVMLAFDTLNNSDVIMSTMASRITSLTIVYTTVYSGADQIKHQSSASLAFVRGIRRSPVNFPHKGPVTRKCFHLMTLSWMTDIWQNTFFQMYYPRWKPLNFKLNFIELCSFGSNRLWVSICSDTSLAANRRQTTTKANNDKGFWRHLASHLRPQWASACNIVNLYSSIVTQQRFPVFLFKHDYLIARSPWYNRVPL